ncbi:hypothetical protein JZ751_024999 [Albula glossodonta]|uniref:BZIP domain-containing protein n=1 Tax=Albula glossodonta TaxID=121402 RepID=A0A8T2PG24_9TELE|nr:hypothetical protein JZ751_024999 [Albula glossodonta]
MASDLMLDFENHVNQQHTMMNNDTGDICIDQGGEWDISLFDELEDMRDADELLRALEDVGEVPGLDLDLDLDLGLPLWNTDACGDTSSSCTDTDITMDSLSPNPTLSSVSSPGSVEALSLYSLSEEPLSPQSQSQPSPASNSSEACSSPDVPLGRKPQRRAAKSSQPVKRPIQLTPKVSIQPKPVITTVPIAHSAAPLQAKTIIIQPLQAVLPAGKPPPVTIQPAPPAGRPVVMPQPAHVLQLRNPQMVPAQSIFSLPDRVVTVPTVSQDRLTPAVTFPAVTQPLVTVTLRNTTPEGDTNVARRLQRMTKNRESASLSRKKKKEYLLTLEARLKLALSENEKLKSENGSLKKQLEGLVTENNVLKATAPKRRAVCLLVVMVFLMLNVGPMSLLDGDSSSKHSAGTTHSGRHLLGFSPDTEKLLGPETPETAIHQATDRLEDSAQEEKALMVVKKEPFFLKPSPPCQPHVNRTKSIKMAHELRGWVHRHEVERTKSRRMTNSQHKTKTILKSPDQKAEVAQIVSVQYTDMSEKSPGSELQVYYAPHRSHYDFFEEIHRRGDTFYVVSFRRNEEHEVMMQIDCEVMDTRILHIKSSSIPPFLRVNHTDSLYDSNSANGQAAPSVGVLSGSA